MTVALDEVTDVVFTTIDQFNRSENQQLAKSVETPLLGAEGSLDSLRFVRFLIEVERHTEDTFGQPISLTDEKALSQRNSPFRTVGTLAQYITQCLNGDVE